MRKECCHSGTTNAEPLCTLSDKPQDETDDSRPEMTKQRDSTAPKGVHSGEQEDKTWSGPRSGCKGVVSFAARDEVKV